MMETHQAAQQQQQQQQQQRLVEVRVEPRAAGPAPAGRHFTQMKALVAVVVVVALSLVSAAFALYFSHFPPACKQDAAPLRDAEGINRMWKLTESDEKGRYDVFTADTAGKYLIYGWVSLTNIKSEKVLLKNTFKKESRLLETKDAGAEVFFFQNVTLVDDSRISLYFSASCTDSLFHVHRV